MAVEAWKPVPGYEDFYEVSDHGRVRALDRWIGHRYGGLRRWRGRELRPTPSHGYWRVTLWSDGLADDFVVHRLVLAAFVGPCPEGQEALHRDNVKTNNHLSNLRYGTRLENMGDRRTNGIGAFKLNEEIVREIRASDLPVPVLAAKFGVAKATVYKVLHRRTWQHA